MRIDGTGADPAALLPQSRDNDAGTKRDAWLREMESALLGMLTAASPQTERMIADRNAEGGEAVRPSGPLVGKRATAMQASMVSGGSQVRSPTAAERVLPLQDISRLDGQGALVSKSAVEGRPPVDHANLPEASTAGFGAAVIAGASSGIGEPMPTGEAAAATTRHPFRQAGQGKATTMAAQSMNLAMAVTDNPASDGTGADDAAVQPVHPMVNTSLAAPVRSGMPTMAAAIASGFAGESAASPATPSVSSVGRLSAALSALPGPRLASFGNQTSTASNPQQETATLAGEEAAGAGKVAGGSADGEISDRAMHVRQHEHGVDVWIRDTHLDAGQTVKLTSRMVADLLNGGMRLRTLTINGESTYREETRRKRTDVLSVNGVGEPGRPIQSVNDDSIKQED